MQERFPSQAFKHIYSYSLHMQSEHDVNIMLALVSRVLCQYLFSCTSRNQNISSGNLSKLNLSVTALLKKIQLHYLASFLNTVCVYSSERLYLPQGYT